MIKKKKLDDQHIVARVRRRLVVAALPAAAPAAASLAAASTAAAVSAAAASATSAPAAMESPLPRTAAAVTAGRAAVPGRVVRGGLSFGHRLSSGYPGLSADRFRIPLRRERLRILVRDVVILGLLLGHQGLDGVPEVGGDGLIGLVCWVDWVGAPEAEDVFLVRLVV
jgi:hypothetical protein